MKNIEKITLTLSLLIGVFGGGGIAKEFAYTHKQNQLKNLNDEERVKIVDAEKWCKEGQYFYMAVGGLFGFFAGSLAYRSIFPDDEPPDFSNETPEEAYDRIWGHR